MCSISTSDKPTKKRKTEHLEQTENGQQDLQSTAEQSNTRLNKKQMTSLPTVPTSDSLSNLLVQGLQSSDDKLINNVVNRKEEIIESTINNLPNAYVEPFFNFLQRSLYEHSENVKYVICLRKLFQCKISQILNLPNIRSNLKMLSDTLDLRCDLLDRCYQLKGRLELMFLMLNKDDKQLKEENIVIYEESSSENEEQSDGEDLFGMMQSDDEQIDDELNKDLLDIEDQFEANDPINGNKSDSDNDEDLMDDDN